MRTHIKKQDVIRISDVSLCATHAAGIIFSSLVMVWFELYEQNH